jgi:hypothetical protein
MPFGRINKAGGRGYLNTHPFCERLQTQGPLFLQGFQEGALRKGDPFAALRRSLQKAEPAD